jgi:hypothetical protein
MDHEAETSPAKVRNSSKIGRKGDPRMHRAVDARIANPKLNLFEALKIGGFEYPSDDDPYFMDSELVTLGQRKNQLCRRIRIALRQCNEKNSFSGKKCCKTNKICRNKSLSYPLSERQLLVQHRNSIASSRLKKESQKDSVVSNHLTVSDTCSKRRTTGAIPYSMNSDKIDFQNILDCQPLGEYIEARLQSGTPVADLCSDASSHLAVESLKQTAISMGMTLDQLALSLANCNDPAFKLKLKSQSRHDFAVALYQHERSVLLNKAMLFAGYSPQIVRNNESPIHVQVALSTWKLEGQRIQESISKLREKGRMPILHHPVGHTPHVDFVVDNRVECYFGTELNQDCALEHAHDETGMSMDFPFCDDSNVYDKNDINFDSDEWNLLADFDSNEFLHRFLSSTDSIQNQAILSNGERRDDISYSSTDTNLIDTYAVEEV